MPFYRINTKISFISDIYKDQSIDSVIYLSTKAPQLSRAIACTILQYDPFTQIQRRAFRPKGVLNIKKDGAVRED